MPGLSSSSSETNTIGARPLTLRSGKQHWRLSPRPSPLCHSHTPRLVRPPDCSLDLPLYCQRGAPQGLARPPRGLLPTRPARAYRCRRNLLGATSLVLHTVPAAPLLRLSRLCRTGVSEVSAGGVGCLRGGRGR